ncbi:MAG: CotH kinase family protein [Myxococcales bacterium]|nr:CotH kinase family protein [Myxococcales bacterium]
MVRSLGALLAVVVVGSLPTIGACTPDVATVSGKPTPDAGQTRTGRQDGDAGQDAGPRTGPEMETMLDAGGDGLGDGPDRDATIPVDAAEADAAVPDLGFVIPRDEEGCHVIHSQELFPTFEITMAAEEWEALKDEWNNGSQNDSMGINPKPYHPVAQFRYDDVVIEDIFIRLRGNPTFWEPLPADKMQFQIRFRTKEKRFLGLKTLALDAATYNRHMLRDRLGLAILRDAGLRAPCANHARLVVNGEYYGIFTNIEKVDKKFLGRTFIDDDGDLWKRAGWEIKTNKDIATEDRILLLRTATTADVLGRTLDLPTALRVFAADAVIPNSDGYWGGGLNGYLYDDPITRKIVLIPWDLDNTFERFSHAPGGEYPVNPDPIVWEKDRTHGRPWYDLLMRDPDWHAQYIETIREIVQDAYQPSVLHERIDTWTAQIEQAVLDDQNKPYDNDLYYQKVMELHEFVDDQHAFLEAWLACWDNGGVADDQGYCQAE